MACTREELTDGRRSRRPPTETGVSVSDALLLATVWMIGMPVEVQARDGSIYSGIFHTACVDDDYAVVLKKAMVVKKGTMGSNVVANSLIETLVVGSEDFVQVVIKGDLSSDKACVESLDMDSEVLETIKPRRESDVTSGSVADDANTLGHSHRDHVEIFDNIVKIDAIYNISSSDGKESEDGVENDPILEDNTLIEEIHVSSPSENFSDNQSSASQDIIDNSILQEPQGLSSGFNKAVEDQSNESPSTDDTAAMDKMTDSTVSPPFDDIKAESHLSTALVPPKDSSTKKNSKGSKLNPGAKIFSPSAMYHRATTPTNFSYMPSANYTVTSLTNVQDEVDTSSFGPPTFPVKFYTYNGVNDGTYVQPIIGQMANRVQPVRYTGQYQSIQSGVPYIHTNPQNIVYGNGRIGPVVFMHSDMLQTAAGFSPVQNSHQEHISKHQRNASTQALQVSMPPGQQQFLLPASVSLPPPFPVSYPVTVPGRMG